MDHADLSQLPPPLREALLRTFESLLDLHNVLTQVYPAQPSAPYPRSATEWLVLDALQAMAPMPATPKQVAEMINKPHEEVQNVLMFLAMLHTIYRHAKGFYSTEAPRPLPAVEARRPSTQYAARIAHIVAQETRRETTSPQRRRPLAPDSETPPATDTPTHEKGTAHD